MQCPYYPAECNYTCITCKDAESEWAQKLLGQWNHVIKFDEIVKKAKQLKFSKEELIKINKSVMDGYCDEEDKRNYDAKSCNYYIDALSFWKQIGLMKTLLGKTEQEQDLFERELLRRIKTIQ